MKFAVEPPDNPANFPRVLLLWRANLLGASGKGHEYFLKHLLGVENAVFNKDSSRRPKEVRWRDPAPEGKLDLLVTMEIRMSTSALYADVALPAAGWYEMHDLNTTDMHPFVHPFNPAIDPPWETRTNWEQFKTIAKAFSKLAEKHLGVRKDLVATPLAHDSPAEISQPDVKDWKKGEVEAIPGKTMPSLSVATRDYPNVYRMMTALGPLTAEAGVGSKGVSWKAGQEYEALKDILGTVKETGIACGAPSLETAKQVAEAILHLAPETNGETAAKAWKTVEEKNRPVASPFVRKPTGGENPVRRHLRPAQKNHHIPRLERNRVRRASLFAIRDQHRRENSVPDPHRKSAIFPGSSLDARFRRAASALPPSSGHDGPRDGRGRTGTRKGTDLELSHPALQMVDPQHLFGHFDHADPFPRRGSGVAQRRGRGKKSTSGTTTGWSASTSTAWSWPRRRSVPAYRRERRSCTTPRKG